jgi:hypothetical protein
MSTGGVPIPPPPVGGDTLDAEINAVLVTLSDEQRSEERFFPDNYATWNEFFQRRYEREPAAYDSPPPPPVHNNAAGHRPWWSAPGRTLENVLTHIEGGNYPIMGMPLPVAVRSMSCRHGSSWMPHRMASSSSSGSATRSATRSYGSAPPPTWRTTVKTELKTEPALPPPTRGSSTGALVIREGSRALSSPAAAAASDLAAEEAARAAVAEAIVRSLQDLVPADNALPMDAALAWSWQD